MANRIQGITVEIGGDTTKLQTALKGLNGEIKSTQTQLKDVEKLLLKEELGEKYINEEDGIENIVFNLDKLSGMFNIMNINLSQTITVMEGPIDSLAISNSIALQGASKKLNGFFDEVENVRYIFDNDMTGKEMSIKKLKDHKNVFLWTMYLKKIHSDIKIKDINDLQKNNMLNMELIDKCFSDDELDVIMI